jgi:hypothetical protein
LKVNNVSEEPATSVFRVENKSALSLPPPLKMQAADFSETFALSYWTTQPHIPAGSKLNFILVPHLAVACYKEIFYQN